MNRSLALILVLGLVTGVAASSPHRASQALTRVLHLPRASLLVETRGRPVLAYQADRLRIPASTMKLLTALAAIQRWGLDHRFSTRFYRSPDHWLWIQGGGDPSLVSEEIDRIVSSLQKRGLSALSGIGLDDSRFAPDLRIPGRGTSDNPYDAPVTALAANFNTVSFRIRKGAILSGETQTPLTAVAEKLARHLGPGKHRINLRDRRTALQQVGELFAAKLRKAGLSVGNPIRIGRVPPGSRLLYAHRSHRTLGDLVAMMLKYSNNFIANSLFLLMGDSGDRREGLTIREAQEAMHTWAMNTFGWKDFRIEDGAGLSRGNRLSARQLVSVLRAFAPYRNLLPEQTDRIRGKTGTLRGVSNYAGFVRRHDRWEPFALLIEQPVPYDLRRRVAEALAMRPDRCTREACVH